MLFPREFLDVGGEPRQPFPGLLSTHDFPGPLVPEPK